MGIMPLNGKKCQTEKHTTTHELMKKTADMRFNEGNLIKNVIEQKKFECRL